MRRLFTLIAVFLGLASAGYAQKFTTQWSRSVSDNSMPEWFGSSHTERGLAATPEYLFVVSRNNEANMAVKVLNPLTGADLGELDVTGVAPGALPLNDVETSDDGQILACNLAFYHEQWAANGTWTFTIYKWSDKDAAPVAYITYDNPDELRLGDFFTVKGDLTGDAVITAAAGGTNKVLRWYVSNGNLNTSPDLIELNGLVETKNNTAGLYGLPKVAPLGVTSSDPFIYSSNKIFPTKFNADGSNIIEELNEGNFYSENMAPGADENAVITFEDDGKTFLATASLMGSSSTMNNAQIKAIDISNGLANATNPFFSKGLGIAENAMWNGDVASTVIDGVTYVFHLYANTGLAGFSFDPNAEPEVKVPVTAQGWRRCVLDSINGRSTRPDWLNENTRTLAYGNGHLYVPVCAAANAEGRILILDASDGSLLAKELDVKAVNEANNFEHDGNVRIADVEVDDAGHILASNLRLTGTSFKIFAWDDEDSAPYQLVEVTPPFGDEDQAATWQQTAYYMDVKGDIKGDAVIIAARSNYSSVYKWVIKDGVVQNEGNPYVHVLNLLPDDGHWGAYGSAALESSDENTNIWVDADLIDPTRINASGETLSVMPTAVSTSETQPHRTTVKYLKYAGSDYILEWNWVWADHTRLINVSGNLETWDDVEFEEVGSYMGQAENAANLGDCDYFVDGDTLRIYTLSTNNGIKMDNVFEYGPEVDVPVTATGWRRCAIDSVDQVSTKPQWLGLNARAVAATKEHIYVVNTAEGNYPGEILILDAGNGSLLEKTLNVAPVNQGNNTGGDSDIRISDVEVDDAGHILASNMRTAGAFNIYVWENEESEPEKLVEVTPPIDIEDPSMTWQQTAYYFDVKGDVKGNAVIVVARANTATTYKWVIKDGIVQNEGLPYVNLYDLPEGTHWGAYPSAAVESGDESTNVWVDADIINPICFDEAGGIIGIIPEEVSTNPGAPHRTAVKHVNYMDRSWILEWNWAWADHIRLIDVSGDLMALNEDNWLEIGGYMGQEANPLLWGDVDYFIHNDTLNVVTISTNNGIKLDKFYPDFSSSKPKKESRLSIYPNPAGNTLRIEHPGGLKAVEFMNVAGLCLKQVEGDKRSIDIGDLPQGIYFVKVTPNEGAAEIRKIIKQ